MLALRGPSHARPAQAGLHPLATQIPHQRHSFQAASPREDRATSSCRHRLSAARKPLRVIRLDLVELTIERLDRMEVGPHRVRVFRPLPPPEERCRVNACTAAELRNGNAGCFRAPLDVPDCRLLVHVLGVTALLLPYNSIYAASDNAQHLVAS